jgi:hypothetical protein
VEGALVDVVHALSIVVAQQGGPGRRMTRVDGQVRVGSGSRLR